MDLNFIECTDKEHWDRFAADSPHGSIFCLTPFLDALSEEYRLLQVVESGEPLAGVALIMHGGQPYPGQYPLTMYQGILLSPRLCNQPSESRVQRTLKVLGFLLAELEQRFDRISLCLHHRFEDLRGFSWFHTGEPERGKFRIELRYSGLLELDPVADFDSYLRSIRHLRLREYRRCQASGFRIQPSDDLQMLDRLHALTFARQGIMREANEEWLLRSISQAALEEGFGELLTCVAPDGAVASATLFLFDWRYAYYLVGANDPQYRYTGAATYLMLESIRRWQARGLAAVDFVGINSPNRGDFKTSFNAVPVRYFDVMWERPRAF
jgi:Acetyltransferase (GNAT) domain